jgi:hypothetical protein
MPALNPERMALTMPLDRQGRLKKFILERRGGNFRIKSSVINEAVETFLQKEGY